MERLADWVVRWRWAVMATAVSVSVWAAWQAARLQSDDDVLQFLPADHPDVVLFRKVNQRFGGLDVAIVGLEAESVFSAGAIAKVRRLTRALADVEGVHDVLSFTEVPDPQPAPDGLRVTPLVMDRLPRSKAELAALRERVLANDMAVGNLVSKDGKAAVVLCFLGNERPPIRIAADIGKTARAVWGEHGLHLAGSPFIRQYLADGTQRDLRRLTPVVAAVVVAVTVFVFRSALGVVLSLGAVGLGVLWTLGFVSWYTGRLTLVDGSLPTILMAIGGAFGVHFLSAFHNAPAPEVRGRLRWAMATMGPPIVASALTTAAGFASFGVMDIAPLRRFGLFAAVGVMAIAGLVLVVIPAVLSFSRRVPAPLRIRLGAAVTSWIIARVIGHRRWLWVFCAAVVMASSAALSRVAPDATLESFFNVDSPPARANDFLRRRFGGATYVQVYFEGDMLSPWAVSYVRDIAAFARSLEGVEQVAAITDSLAVLNKAMGGRPDVPETHRRLASLYPFLEGTAAVEQMVAPSKDAALIQIRVRDVDSDAVRTVVDRLEAFVAHEVPAAVAGVQVAAFPTKAFAEEYSKPPVVDATGTVVRPAEPVRLVDLSTDSKGAALRRQWWDRCAHRIAWVLTAARRRYGRAVSDEADVHRVALQVLSRVAGRGVVQPDAWQSRVRTAVEELLGEDTALLEPECAQGACPEAWEHWNGRVSRVAGAVAAAPAWDEGALRDVLARALPFAAQRDGEGLAMIAESLATVLWQQRMQALARRAADDVLAAVRWQHPPDSVRDAVSAAATDALLPVIPVLDNTGEGTSMLARVTGSPVINVALCDSTVRNQINSLLVAVAILLVVLAVLFGSLSTAVVGLLPALLTLFVAVGALAAMAVPIDMTTSMIAAIAMGIGVDYAIHYLWRVYKRGDDPLQAASVAGPSIITGALQVALGFGVLAISSIVPMQRFGVLVAFTMITAAACTLVLLPTLVRAPRAVAEESLAPASDSLSS